MLCLQSQHTTFCQNKNTSRHLLHTAQFLVACFARAAETAPSALVRISTYSAVLYCHTINSFVSNQGGLLKTRHPQSRLRAAPSFCRTAFRLTSASFSKYSSHYALPCCCFRTNMAASVPDQANKREKRSSRNCDSAATSTALNLKFTLLLGGFSFLGFTANVGYSIFTIRK